MTCSELMNQYGCRVIVNGTPINKAIRTREELDSAVLQSITKSDAIHASIKCEPMDKDWKEWIKGNWWGRKEREEDIDEALYEIRERLLSLCGEAVCMAFYEEDAEAILKYGQVWPGYKAIMKPGMPCQCHANSADLWYQNRDKLKLCTGYALSEDGMWRQHSWCIWKKPRSLKVVETTTPRVLYYGFVMDDEQALQFRDENW